MSRAPIAFSDAPASLTGADTLARLRTALLYVWRHRRLARLRHPRRLTEWIQHRKLHDRDPRLPLLADKLAVKDIVAAKLGPAWITPTLWHGTVLPDHPEWPLPFVVKSRHGCNQRAFVRSTAEDWPRLQRRAQRWMASRYGYWLDEWAYGEIPRGLLAEPFIGSGGVLPIDYKLFVFGGHAAFVQVHLARETAHRWIVFDRDWRQMTPAPDPPARPRALNAMIAAAETLGQGFDFVRIDFYEVAGTPRFGEMTFYPGSGLYRLDPPGLDAAMGAMWRAARERGPG